MWVDEMELKGDTAERQEREEKWSILFCICSVKSDSKGPKERCCKDS